MTPDFERGIGPLTSSTRLLSFSAKLIFIITQSNIAKISQNYKYLASQIALNSKQLLTYIKTVGEFSAVI